MPCNYLYDLVAREPLRVDTILPAAREALELGNVEEALACCSAALTKDPRNLFALALSADCFNHYGRHLDALLTLQGIRAAETDCLIIHIAEAHQLQLMERYEEASYILRNILVKDNSLPLIREYLAHTYINMGQYQDALLILEPLLIDPIDERCVHQVIQTLLNLDRSDEAIHYALHNYERNKSSDNARILANCYQFHRQPEFVSETLLQASALYPDDERLFVQCVSALFDLGRNDTAWGLIRRRCASDEIGNLLRSYQGHQYLLDGDYKQGFENYSFGIEFTHKDYKQTQFTTWNGQSLSGKDVIVVALEHDLRDILLFSRYLSPLASEAKQVIALVQPYMARLFRCINNEISVHVDTDLVKSISDPNTIWLPISSLPLRFNHSPAPPLQVESTPNLPDIHKANNPIVTSFVKSNSFPKVGFALNNPNFTKGVCHFKTRVDPDFVLTPFKGLPINLIDLDSDQSFANIINNEACSYQNVVYLQSSRDIYQTAVLISQLDLLITSDHPYAFLAAMMGIHTFAILPPNPHFMFMREGNISPWFDKIDIIRSNSWSDFSSISVDYESKIDSLLKKLLHDAGK